jgi:hypothetical protein
MRTLFLHPVGSQQNIANIYKQAFAEAIELYVLSAYLRTWDTTLKINKQCKVFSFIVGKDFGITRKKACIKVLKWLPSQLRPFFFVADAISGFHPKAVFWKTGNGECYSLVGSSNLSDAGWNTNYEANTFDKLSGQMFENVRTWVMEIRDYSVPMSKEWLDTYIEAKGARLNRTRKAGTQGRPQPPVSLFTLPPGRSNATIIQERRDKKGEFKEIRGALLSAIRRCASSKISNNKFHDILEKTWGSRARIQGWGWEVKGRDSNFSALCRGIISIVNADQRARDHTVIKVIDALKAQGVPTRRALLSELLCQFFPDEYPILNEPIASYARRVHIKAPHGSSEGEKYLYLALSLRAALRSNRKYPAKDLLELDGMIWKSQYLRSPH